MNKAQRLDRIIEQSLPLVRSGQETIDSILNKYPTEAAALRPLLEAGLWITDVSTAMEPRQSFIRSSRKRLEHRISILPHHSPFQRFLGRYSPQRWIFNLTAPIVLILLAAFILNSLVLTARLSIPGDPFYSTKLAIEDIQLAFTFNREDKTDLYIQFSRERTTEFVQLVLEGDYSMLPGAASRLEGDIIDALHSLYKTSVINEINEPPAMSNLRDALSNEIFLLNVLRDTSPSSAHKGIDLAIQVAQSGILALR